MNQSFSSQKEQGTSFLDPITTVAKPHGYTAPAIIQSNNKEILTQVMPFAAKILKDSLLLNKLCDRVYELMKEDLRQQKEYQNYRGL